MNDIDIIDLLTRSGTYVLAMAVFILTWVLRAIVETAWPSLKKHADANCIAYTYKTAGSRWWNEVLLYIIPVAIGGLFGLTVSSSFLFGDIHELSTKVTLGGVVGWLASFLYKILRKAIKQKTGVDILPDTTLVEPGLVDPPAGPGQGEL
jgi:undecaprenyl pyrophosphate phosphatase UppP